MGILDAVSIGYDQLAKDVKTGVETLHCGNFGALPGSLKVKAERDGIRGGVFIADNVGKVITLYHLFLYFDWL